MNIVFIALLGCFISVVRATVTFGTPYNIFGNTGGQVKSRYPEAVVTYGPPQRPLAQTASQRGHFFPLPQRHPYLPALPRAYTPVQPRAYPSTPQRTVVRPAQTRAYPYGQPRAYTAAQPRAYTAAQPRTALAAHPQPYTPVHTQPKAQLHPRPAVFGFTQPRAYTHPATAAVYGQQKLPQYFIPAKQTVLRPVARQPITGGLRQPMNAAFRQRITGVRQPINAAVRQPIRPVAVQPNSAFVRQPIRNVQTPLSRTLAPKIPTLYPVGNRPLAPLPRGYAAVARPVVPVTLATYGRNHIPKTPARNIVPGKPSPAIGHLNANNKRNNIALSGQVNPQTPGKEQTTRNYINGVIIPEKLTANAHKEVPIKPHVTPNNVNGQSPIKPIKPDVPPSSPAAHKLSTFLKSVKKLQDTLKGNTMKQGLIYYNDDVSNKSRHRPTNFAPPTRKLGSLGSPGGSRVTFNEEPAKQPAIIPETKAINQAGSERVNIAKTEKNVANKTPQDGKSSKNSKADEHDAQKPLSKNIVDAGKPQPASTADATKPRTENTVGSTKSPPSPAAQVDLGLLKEKVLHSNNSQFLKRVLQVLKKYTKLMKTSMAGKTESEKNLDRNVLNASMPETKGNTQESKDAEKSSKKNLDGGMDLTNALNSTKTAVKIFDLLNSASKENIKNSLVKELNDDTTKMNPDSLKDSSKTSETDANASDKKSSNSKPVQKVLDENASKKGIIETEHNMGKRVFNLDKLKYGLERGNTID